VTIDEEGNFVDQFADESPAEELVAIAPQGAFIHRQAGTRRYQVPTSCGEKVYRGSATLDESAVTCQDCLAA
jgi:hypothetical protein